MRVVLRRAKYFITADGKFYGDNENPERIRNILKGHNLLKPSVKSTQLSFFDTLPSYITGNCDMKILIPSPNLVGFLTAVYHAYYSHRDAERYPPTPRLSPCLTTL